MPETFSAQLAAHQRRLGLSQAELAKLLEISPRQVWGWLNGKTPSLILQAGALTILKTKRTPKPALYRASY